MTGDTPGAKTRIPLLLLHGALGSGAQMHRLADAFRDERRVFAPDLPGHGIANDLTTGFSIRGFADGVRAMLDGYGIGKADVVGYSMGGYVGLFLARHHPDRIGRV